jgi:hypothetical protein
MRYLIVVLVLFLIVCGSAAAHLRLSHGTIDPCEAVADQIIQSEAPVRPEELAAPGMLAQNNTLRANLRESILRSLRKQDGWPGCYRSLVGGGRTTEEDFYYQKRLTEARRRFGLDGSKEEP